MPNEDSKMKFWQHKNMLERPFLVFADIESTLIPLDAGDSEGKLNRHEPNSCCFYFIATQDSKRNYMKTFVGETCIYDMLRELYKLGRDCHDEMRKNEKCI